MKKIEGPPAPAAQTPAPPRLVRVDFEPQELVALRNMLNVAVKAEGMPVAAICVALDGKLLAAAQTFQRGEKPD
jgi:hypothetical protein